MRFLPLFATIIAALLAGVAVWQITESRDEVDDVAPYKPLPSPSQEPVIVAVDRGQSTEQIGKRLEQAGVLDSGTQFRVLVALLGLERMIQAGEYEFQRNTPALDVVYRMRNGVLASRSVTVVEGWRIEEIADAVATQGVPRQQFISAARRGQYEFEFLQELRSGSSLEGYLYPATYPIRTKDTAQDVVERMLRTFDESVPQDVRAAASEAGLSLHDVLTLASIIEREAQVPEERPIMAQVFLKRLRLGIALEADPTVQYAVAQNADSVAEFGYWKQELTLEDLEVDSPYNTYLQLDLPPGPICNPGLDSTRAVVAPADTNYLYFVAKPDGSHAFAETLAEHLANVERYRPQ